MPGFFDEFVEPSKLNKLPKTEETEGDFSLRPETKEQIAQTPKQDSVAKPTSFFEEFITPPDQKQPLFSGVFDEFVHKRATPNSGVFNEFIKTDKKDMSPDTQKILGTVKDLAFHAALGGFSNPKTIEDMNKLDVAILGEIDPIKFKPTDFIPTPLRILTTAGKLFAREEAAFAQAALRELKGETTMGEKILMGTLGPLGILANKGFQQGITGEAKSEYQEGQLAQLGDIARYFDLPEPVAATLGFTAQMALPTSLLLGEIGPAGKLFAKADNLATNQLARKLLINQFKSETAELAAVKEGVLAQLSKDLPLETITRFRKEVIDATDKTRLAKLFFRQEEKAATKAALEKGERSSFITAANSVKHAYEETLTAPRVLDMHDGFQQYQGINARLGKALNVAETNANYTGRKLTHDFLMDVQKLGFDAIPEDLDFKLAINSFARQGEKDAVEQLLKQKGLSEVPKLTPNEAKILDLAEDYLNKDVDALAQVYEKVTGQKFVKVDKYSAPLRYMDEPDTAVSQLVRRNYKRPQVVDKSKAFTERVEYTTRTPRSDFLNLVTAQLHDQQWMIHVLSRVESTRKFLEHPIYAKAASKDTLKYWGEYLSAIQNRGSNAVASGMQGMLKQARLNLNSAILGYRLSSIMIQPFAVFDAMAYATTRFGPRAALDILNETARSWVNPRAASNYIRGSKALVTRQGGELAIRESLNALHSTGATKKLRELIPTLIGNKTLDKFDKGYRDFMAHGFKMLQEADVRTAAGVHKGLKKIMAKHGIPNANEEVDFMMSLLSGSSDVTMRPLVLSRGELQKLWFTFQTFMLNRWGMTAHDIVAGGILNAGKNRELGIKALTKQFSDPETFQQSIKTGQYAILSGEKAGLAATENAKRTKSLLSDLRSQGFKPIPVEGTYGGVTEKSFLVPGLTEQEAFELGQKYGQESVLTPKGLIYSDGSGIHAANTIGTTFDQEATDFFSKVKLGDKEIKFQVPIDFNAKVPLDPAALTKPLQAANAMQQRFRAIMGLGLIGAAEVSEQMARAGIYQLTTGKEGQPQSTAQTLLMALPGNIPYFGSIMQAVAKNTSALPPVLKTVENLFVGAKRMTTAEKDEMRIKGALKAVQAGASLTLGIPGTSQLFDILQGLVPEPHKKIRIKRSKRQEMIARLRK